VGAGAAARADTAGAAGAVAGETGAGAPIRRLAQAGLRIGRVRD
jgi:hypothetical protein